MEFIFPSQRTNKGLLSCVEDHFVELPSAIIKYFLEFLYARWFRTVKGVQTLRAFLLESSPVLLLRKEFATMILVSNVADRAEDPFFVNRNDSRRDNPF